MRRWISSIGTIMMCGLLLVGCGNADKASAEEEQVVEAQIQSTEAFGKVVASKTENITIEVPGKVSEVVVENGQIVKQGDVLFKMDMSAFLQEVEALEQNLKIKELELENLQGKEEGTNKLEDSALYKLEAEQNELERLTTKYKDTKIKYDNGSHEQLVQLWKEREVAATSATNAASELESSRTLLEEGIISESELKLIEGNASNASLIYDSAKVAYSLQKNQLKEELASLSYQIQLLKSNVASLEMVEGDSTVNYELKVLEVASVRADYELMKGKIEVPYLKENGEVICHETEAIVYDLVAVEGDYISGLQGAKTYSLLSKDALEIQTEISEDFIGEVQLGAEVRIIPIADRNRSYLGSVTYISDMAYSVGGDSVIMVHIQVEDDDGFLKPNYSVDVEIFGQ